jgi:hypothetical protein
MMSPDEFSAPVRAHEEAHPYTSSHGIELLVFLLYPIESQSHQGKTRMLQLKIKSTVELNLAQLWPQAASSTPQLHFLGLAIRNWVNRGKSFKSAPNLL